MSVRRSAVRPLSSSRFAATHVWMLVEADVGHGRTLTSWPSLQTHIRNAGGRWVDQEVVVGNVITVRSPITSPRPVERPSRRARPQMNVTVNCNYSPRVTDKSKHVGHMYPYLSPLDRDEARSRRTH